MTARGLDLARVEFMDSTGLHALTDAHRRFQRDGRRLSWSDRASAHFAS